MPKRWFWQEKPQPERGSQPVVLTEEQRQLKALLDNYNAVVARLGGNHVPQELSVMAIGLNAAMLSAEHAAAWFRPVPAYNGATMLSHFSVLLQEWESSR